jgi:hypothetical protein
MFTGVGRNANLSVGMSSTAGEDSALGDARPLVSSNRLERLTICSSPLAGAVSWRRSRRCYRPASCSANVEAMFTGTTFYKTALMLHALRTMLADERFVDALRARDDRESPGRWDESIPLPALSSCKT